MNYIVGQKYNGFLLKNQKEIKEINSTGLVFQHVKSGAKMMVLSNDDDNKVFSVSFRTPPHDNTGVAHILEHSVLCGSKNFPAKDPFVELVKGSLNTFLNAMTFSDKTMYPVASVNNKDFQNLMHVYLDAVFYPNIYKKEEIFKQEGWHYELEHVRKKLTYNGVVYNEMKGVFSQPDQILYRKIQNSLFDENHTYAMESGGEPNEITDLKYNDFLDFHRKYYHPSNSYLYLYGNMDIDEKLQWIDEHYLSKFNQITVDSEIPYQEPFAEPQTVQEYYSISSNESDQEKTFMSYNVVVGNNLDKELYLAFEALDYVLLSSSGAKLKKALIDAGIGKDVYGSYDNSILQPTYSVVVKYTEANRKKEFLAVIRDTLQQMVRFGIDKKQLLAAITKLEFRSREADFGRQPKGLIYSMKIMDSWLYHEDEPFKHLEYEEVFQTLKEGIDNGYFENLIEKYLLNNTHASVVMILPKKGLTTKNENRVMRKLRSYKMSLSQTELSELVYHTRKLKEYQEEPSPVEDLEAIPMLALEDIEKKATPFHNKELEVEGVKVIWHDIFTSGISYFSLYFHMSAVPLELVPYVGILKAVLAEMNTKSKSYEELSNAVDTVTGALGFGAVISCKQYNEDAFDPRFLVSTKALYANVSEVLELIDEIIGSTLFDDKKRLKEIIGELKSRLAAELTKAGHAASAARATAYFSKVSYYKEKFGGIDFYGFIEEIEDDFESHYEQVVQNLKQLTHLIFNRDNLIVSYTGNQEGVDSFLKSLSSFIQKLSNEKLSPSPYLEIETKRLNEGFMTSSQVQYVAKSGNFIKAGYEFTGALNVLKVILGYEYLWNQVRVQGGAYGCMCNFARTGNGYMVSYRDPNLSETLNVFDNAPAFVQSFEVSPRDMLKYIIGAISDLDTPLNPSAKGIRSMDAYLSEITYEQIQKSRDQILSVDVNTIRSLAPIVQAVIEKNNICVIGNETKIRNERENIKIKKQLFK